MERKKKNNIIKWLGIASLAVILCAGVFTYMVVKRLKDPGTFGMYNAGKGWIYVFPESSWDDVSKSITELYSVKYPSLLPYLHLISDSPSPAVGAYTIHPSESLESISKRIGKGEQDQVSLTLPLDRLTGDTERVLAKYLMYKKDEYRDALRDRELIQSLNIQDTTLLNHVLPGEYTLFWNTSPKEVVTMLVKRYEEFWSKERLERAESLGLTPFEVRVLASIVSLESRYQPELATIAGLYLNRLRLGMPLQADPTIIFAHQDYSIVRVLKKHLEIDSPYNTYKNKGLPPTPICVPSQEAMEAVLNAQSHNFLYMCADSDFSGKHIFAADYATHLKNARLFQEELNKRGIK